MNAGITRRWLIQAGLGIMLIVLLGVHLAVNHWVAPQGLLTYADIIHYYDILGIAWMEATFLIVVVIHCLLGIHSMLLDLNLRPGSVRAFSWLIFFVGFLAIGYGTWLISIVRSLSMP